MSEIKNTRLRYLTASSPADLEAKINTLPFKVEIKSINLQNKKWVVFFVLPETAGINLVSE